MQAWKQWKGEKSMSEPRSAIKGPKQHKYHMHDSGLVYATTTHQGDSPKVCPKCVVEGEIHDITIDTVYNPATDYTMFVSVKCSKHGILNRREEDGLDEDGPNT